LVRKIEKQPEEDILLSEEQVFDVIEFARSYGTGIYNSYLNPDLVSGRMKDINMNPMAAEEASLATAIKEPKNNEKQFRAFSQAFEVSSMVYKRLLGYSANMLSFDITYTSSAKSVDDYNTAKYKKDLDAVENFLDRFDYKKEFRVIVKEMLRNDTYFGVFRQDLGNRYVIQELPPEYCKITGRWENGFLFSFNMYWFLQPGVDIDMYPTFFKKKYKEIWQSPNTTNRYIPSLPPELRAGSTWVYWVDVPVDIGVCFKMQSEIATNLPYFAPMFADLLLQPLMRNLQKNINMAAASKLVMGEVPFLQKDVKATVRDSISISPALLGQFMALVRNAISEAIKVASAPLENIRGISFDGDNELYSKYQRTTVASSGANTNLLFSDEIKPNAVETQLSLNVDEQIVTTLYPYFNEFVEYHANKNARTFKFMFYFEGTDFYLNKSERQEAVMGLFDKGIILYQKIAAAYSMKPSQMRKYMEEAQAMDFMSKLTPPAIELQKVTGDIQLQSQKELANVNAKNQKDLAKVNAELAPKTPPVAGKAPKVAGKQPAKAPAAKKPVAAKATSGAKGRPKMKDSKISEEGLNTRSQATNVGRGGKTP